MIFEVRLSDRAIETYEYVVSQLRERWGDAFMTKFESKLEKCVKNLKSAPQMYPITDEELALRKCIVHPNCSIFYRILGNVVLIDYFWDNRQEPIL